MLTNERFEAIVLLVKFLSAWALGIAGVVISLAKYFKYLEVKITEEGLKPTRIKEFIESMKSIEGRVDSLDRSDHQMDERIDTLERDYRELIRQMTDNFLGRKK